MGFNSGFKGLNWPTRFLTQRDATSYLCCVMQYKTCRNHIFLPVCPSLQLPLLSSLCSDVRKPELLSKFYGRFANDKIEKDEMDGACSAYGAEERPTQGIDGET